MIKTLWKSIQRELSTCRLPKAALDADVTNQSFGEPFLNIRIPVMKHFLHSSHVLNIILSQPIAATSAASADVRYPLSARIPWSQDVSGEGRIDNFTNSVATASPRPSWLAPDETPTNRESQKNRRPPTGRASQRVAGNRRRKWSSSTPSATSLRCTKDIIVRDTTTYDK